MSLILFFAGLWFGGIIGVFTTCIFQIFVKWEEKDVSKHYLYSR